MLTQCRLKELLNYNPETGEFSWISRTKKSSVKLGRPTGSPNGAGYIIIVIDKRKYRAHRLAWLYMNGVWPEFEIDHKDQNSSNNKFSNLRPATHAQNMKNVPKPSHNTSGVKGACYCKKNNKWRASIKSDGKWRHLGYFGSPEEAGNAYKKASESLHGEFGHF